MAVSDTRSETSDATPARTALAFGLKTQILAVIVFGVALSFVWDGATRWPEAWVIPLEGWLTDFINWLKKDAATTNTEVIAITGYYTDANMERIINLWKDSMRTMTIVLVAVPLSAALGLGLGVWVTRSKRAAKVFTPMFDFMQATPHLAYLPVLGC